MFGASMSPQVFIQQIVDATAAKVGAAVQTLIKETPARIYDVIRQTPAGPVQQQITLQQMLAELTDTMKVSNDLAKQSITMQQYNLQAIGALYTELQENRKLAQKMVKKKKRVVEEDDEDED